MESRHSAACRPDASRTLAVTTDRRHRAYEGRATCGPRQSERLTRTAHHSYARPPSESGTATEEPMGRGGNSPLAALLLLFWAIPSSSSAQESATFLLTWSGTSVADYLY